MMVFLLPILQLRAAQPPFGAKSRNPGALPQTSSTGSLDCAFASLGMTIWLHAPFEFSSFSAENFPKNSKPPRRPVGVHHLRELDQTNCSRELGIFHCGRHTPCRLRVRQIGRYFENLPREMIDSVQKTAAASNENAGAQIAKVRFLFESAFEQFKRFPQTQVNDGVQRFAVDLFSRKAGIVLQQNHFAWQTISQNAAALFDF